MASSTKLLRKKKNLINGLLFTDLVNLEGYQTPLSMKARTKNRDHDKGTLIMVSCTFVSHALSLMIYKQHKEFRQMNFWQKTKLTTCQSTDLSA